jgi:hypothetical protein
MNRQTLTMLLQAPAQIRRDSNVQSTLVWACKNIDDRLTGHDRSRPRLLGAGKVSSLRASGAPVETTAKLIDAANPEWLDLSSEVL